MNMLPVILVAVLVMPGGLLVLFAWPWRQEAGDPLALTLGAVMVLTGGFVAAQLLFLLAPGFQLP
jgi:hypothetical protein